MRVEMSTAMHRRGVCHLSVYVLLAKWVKVRPSGLTRALGAGLLVSMLLVLLGVQADSLCRVSKARDIKTLSERL